VTIRYFADIRALTGCGEETWTKAAPDMRSLLEGLAAQHGSAFGKRVFEGDRLNSTIIIFINGRDVAHWGATTLWLSSRWWQAVERAMRGRRQ
jgi:molybdopterin converting factor small subunit